MATNRAKATALSAILLEQVIIDLAKDFNLSITYITGNESRAGDSLGSTEIMVSDNYDVTIFQMLKLMFRNENITFIDGNCSEKVVQVNDKNILLLHGHQINSNISKSIQQIKGKYNDLGVQIDYVLFGHIHECLIADLYARSSSLCGANAYSDHTLQLSSRASQNICIIGKNEINTIKIDLQETNGYNGYDIDEDLEAYNAKSASKTRQEKYVIVNVI